MKHSQSNSVPSVSLCGDDLPVNCYRAEQVRELDRLAIEGHGIKGFALMRRAAKAAFDVLLACWPAFENGDEMITIICGTGNNGGDGYLMASLIRQQGLPVQVLQVGDISKLHGDALAAFNEAKQVGVTMSPFADEVTLDAGLIVDALLGTGLSGAVRDIHAKAIDWMNAQQLPVLAVDIPSGLCSNTGQLLGVAVNADVTVTFIGLKQGLLTAVGPDMCGDVYYADLAVPAEIFSRQPVESKRLLLSYGLTTLPIRKPSAHKGHSGHVLVIGGDQGMAGAVAMASEAAARCGAGLVSCATQPQHVAAIVGRHPEIMAHGVGSGQQLAQLLSRATVLVLGPGLGQRAWGEQLLQQAIHGAQPMVVDADALNMLSQGRVVKTPYRDNWILTPHPAEAARLLSCSTAEVQRDRFAAVRELQARFGGAVILKGAGSLVASADRPLGICTYGNPGMAVGGMGDVLSGVLGALLAQGLSVADAACLGVCLHAYAGDLAAEQGSRGMLATDLMPFLRLLINGGR